MSSTLVPLGFCKDFNSEYNVMSESYEDLMTARTVVRVVDKHTDKPMIYSQAIDHMALRLHKDPTDVFVDVFKALAQRLTKQRIYEGRDEYSGAKIVEIKEVPFPSFLDHLAEVGAFNYGEDIRVVPKPSLLLQERKKLVKYGRY